MILDSETLQNEVLTEQAQEMVEEAAEILYGLIHARYILTTRGLAAMMDKFKGCDFGRCPRVYCNGQACLPVGLSGEEGRDGVKCLCKVCTTALRLSLPCVCIPSAADAAAHVWLPARPAWTPAPDDPSPSCPAVFPPCRHPPAVHCEAVLPSVRRRVLPTLQVPRQPGRWVCGWVGSFAVALGRAAGGGLRD